MWLIKSIIYFLISLIEKIELKESNEKILKTLDCNLSVETDTDFQKSDKIHITKQFKPYKLTLESGEILLGADNHIVFGENYNEIFIKHLTNKDKIWTKTGLIKVKSVKKCFSKVQMFDLTVNHPNHRYWTNNILSHNTITSAIYILHYALFNNDKNILIAANKGDTAKEILDKIKLIYQGLPYFLQKGISVWNQKTVRFDNNCNIKGFNMTATSSIGNTADFVYIDEFAYIQDSISEKFYKSIQPTLISVENSKMIITSTPNGDNLFKKLFIDAEEGKNNFASMRVYWYQVPGRNVSYVRLLEDKLKLNKFDKKFIYDEIINHFNPNDEIINGLPLTKIGFDENGKEVIHIQNNENVSKEDIMNFQIKNNSNKLVRLEDISNISTWRENAIKNIGGVEAFNQEYDLKFTVDSKSLISEKTLKRLKSNEEEFNELKIDILEEKLNWDYFNLKWSKNFNISKKEDIWGVISVDVSEGLGEDYSVINIFQIKEKDFDLIEKEKENYEKVSDFFSLDQIGMFRSNVVSIDQLSELLYLLAFEFFDENKFKIVLEINNHGHAIVPAMKSSFNGENLFGTHIFLKTKHRKDSIQKSLGLKVNSENKKLLVKDYQLALKGCDINIYNKETIKEMQSFIKHRNNNGSVTYKADGNKHDDQVMTIVNLTCVFKDNYYFDMVEDYKNQISNGRLNNIISEHLDGKKPQGTDYDAFFKGKKLSNKFGR